MKKFLAILLALAMTLSLAACGGEPENPGSGDNTVPENNAPDDSVQDDASAPEAAEDGYVLNIASLKGPTTMGMVKMMKDNADTQKYNFSMFGAADEIVGLITKGETDIANIPCNLAAVLYQKTQKGLTVLDINTLGVLYVLASSDSGNLATVADLKGKTVYSTGKGTTPEYVFNYILRSNGVDPEADVNIEYLSEATEVAAKMSESADAIAVLPQPYVTVAMNQNENLKIVFDLTEEWEKIDGSQLVTGVTVVRNEVLEQHPEAVEQFLSDYSASVEYVTANTDDAAALVGEFDIVAEPVAKKALPYCNIVFMTGDDMKTNVSAYLKVLYDSDPTSVGGELPDEQFYRTEE